MYKWVYNCTSLNSNLCTNWNFSVPNDMDIKFNFNCSGNWSLALYYSDWTEIWHVHNWDIVSLQSWKWIKIFAEYDCVNSLPLAISYKQVNIPVLESWTSAFSGVLTSVSSSVSEFIPYIVYIWIWLLTASIWFVAIKRLLNRLKSKVLNPFRK